MIEQDLQVIRDIEAAIYALPATDQQEVYAMVKLFKEIIAKKGNLAVLAFALVGAELQALNP